MDVDDATTLNADLDVDGDVVFHDDFLMDVTGKEFKITNGSANKFQISVAQMVTLILKALKHGGSSNL